MRLTLVSIGLFAVGGMLVIAQGGPHITENLCVLDDWRKFSVVILGLIGGSYVGLTLRIEHDDHYAKAADFKRRMNYASVSFIYGLCTTPYYLMRISETQPKALCLALALLNAAGAWFMLEIFWVRGKRLAGLVLDKILGPVPAEDRKAAKPRGASTCTQSNGSTSPTPPTGTHVPSPK